MWVLIRMSGSIPRTADTISSTIEVMVSLLKRIHSSPALAAIQAAARCGWGGIIRVGTPEETEKSWRQCAQ